MTKDAVQLVDSDNNTIICFPTALAYRSKVVNVGFASLLFSRRDNATRSIPPNPDWPLVVRPIAYRAGPH